MAKVKHTKNELRTQREALRRFDRFLPMLQLKKQQLQTRLRGVATRLEEVGAEEESVRARLSPWVSLFGEEIDFGAWLSLGEVRVVLSNVAGVEIPMLEGVSFAEGLPDLLTTPSWVDDGEKILQELARLRVERTVLEKQHALLAEELRTTSQRVNLFEKVKIPEAQENIRVIRIFLGDEQMAAVARAKIAKAKTAGRRAA